AERRPEQLPFGEEVLFADRRGADEQRVPERDVVRSDDDRARLRHVLAAVNLPAAQGTHEAPEQEAGGTIVQAHRRSKSAARSTRAVIDAPAPGRHGPVPGTRGGPGRSRARPRPGAR